MIAIKTIGLIIFIIVAINLLIYGIYLLANMPRKFANDFIERLKQDRYNNP